MTLLIIECGVQSLVTSRGELLVDFMYRYADQISHRKNLGRLTMGLRRRHRNLAGIHNARP